MSFLRIQCSVAPAKPKLNSAFCAIILDNLTHCDKVSEHSRECQALIGKFTLDQNSNNDDMTVSYVARRIALFIAMVWVGITLVFLLTRLAPGDPIEAKVVAQEAVAGNTGGDINAIVDAYRRKFDLDQPLPVQYITYVSNILRGDFGYSLTNYPARVIDKINAAMPWSIGLIGVTTFVSVIFGSLVGALIAWRRSYMAINIFLPVLMVTAAVPFFLFGLVLQFFLGTFWQLLPTAFGKDPGFILGFNIESAWQIIKHGMLPATAIIIGSTGFWGLGMRAMMVTTAGEDFMVLGDAKGLKERRLFLGYAVRNVLLPQLTALAIALAYVASGQVLVEVVFNYPGLGLLLRNAIGESDYFMIQGIALTVIIAVAIALLIMDLIYPLIDPRITYRRR